MGVKCIVSFFIHEGQDDIEDPLVRFSSSLRTILLLQARQNLGDMLFSTLLRRPQPNSATFAWALGHEKEDFFLVTVFLFSFSLTHLVS